MINHDQFSEPIATDDGWDLDIDPNAGEGKELFDNAKLPKITEYQAQIQEKYRSMFGI